MRTAILASVLLAATAAAAAESESGSSIPPAWLQQPSAEEVSAVFPKEALAKGHGGRAVIECQTGLDGVLKDCKVTSEEPAGEGFGAAALQLTPRFLMKLPTEDGKPLAITVHIPVEFRISDFGAFDAPDWLRQPNPDELRAAWPKDALTKGVSGRAVMDCEVEPQGTLERCKVISEEPAGQGFGTSALLLAPSFEMKPAKRDGKPIRSTVRIPINFKTDGPARRGTETMLVLPDPIWASAPTFNDLKAAWPARAKVDAAHVSMRCRLTREGTLHECEVLSETPARRGFGNAAIALATSKFRVRTDPAWADKLAKAYVNLAVHFNNPMLNTPRAVVEPKWITMIDPAKAQSLFPSKAADAGMKSGKGFADCAVAPDGHLVDCRPAGAAPEGLGFAEAAVQVASIMQMNPWTDGGGPVDGVRIRLPIAFKLAPDAPAVAKP